MMRLRPRQAAGAVHCCRAAEVAPASNLCWSCPHKQSVLVPGLCRSANMATERKMRSLCAFHPLQHASFLFVTTVP